MMDRNREARRAAAMANGLPRRRHRTTTGGSLRESPENETPLELQETAARLRDRTSKKDRDREMRERDRERERDRLSRSKRRRGDKYLHGSNREDGGGAGGGADDDSSEESVNDEDEEDDDGRIRYVPPPNPLPMSSSSVASTITSQRKSYPPPSKVFRVAPTWKAPDEMIGVSIPRKARSASTKRGHDCWSTAGGVGVGEQVHRQSSSSPVRSTMTATAAATVIATVPPASPGPPMSPSSSNVSIKKKIANGPKQQRPPKSSSKPSPSIQDEIEIEVAEVLYGLMRQSQAPSKQDRMPNDSTKLDSRSTADSKTIVSSPSPTSPSGALVPHNISSINPTTSTPPLTTVAPKRKRPRPYPEDFSGGLGPRSSPISTAPKAEGDQATKLEVASPNLEKNGGSAIENGGDLANMQDNAAEPPSALGNNGILSDAKQSLVEESAGIRNGMVRAKMEEACSSHKLESPQNHDRVESSTTLTKPNSAHVEQENHKEEKFEIDLMAPPPQSRTSPEREEEMAEYGGEDEKSVVTDREADAKESAKPKEEENEKTAKNRGGGEVGSNAAEAEEGRAECEPAVLRHTPVSSQKQELNLNGNGNGKEREKNIDLQLDLDKSSMNDDKLNIQKQQLPPLKPNREDANTDNKHGGQLGSAPLPMSVPGGWHGGLAPMGYVGPLQGVVSMDGTPMASPPIQSPHFLFSQPKPKRCATHCYIARSISVHQQVMKMNPFWPAAAAAAAVGTAPLFGGKPYNLNMVPSADLHAGRGVVVNSSQDNKGGQPFTFFPAQPAAAASKDKSPHTPSVPDSAQKKQFSLQPALPSATPNNILHAPGLFFPMQQQSPVANVRPSSTKSTSTPGVAASTSASTSAPMGAVAASNTGPAMSFSYGGNEFMAILGNGAYPFPIPTHVGSAPPYRGSHPQAMPFFNGSFYSSQMPYPSQLQQQQAPQPSQSLQTQQQQTQQNASISTASSSSQKHLQSQLMRPPGNSAPAAVNPNQGSQNFQATTKARTSQPHHDMGNEDRPSAADSRTRQNMTVYGQNFAMPFHAPSFALMTPPPMGGGGNNAAGVSNGNLGDKKQQQQPQQTPAFPMSFTTINGATTPGLDISSIAHNHAFIQNLPESARPNYQIMAAQAAQQKITYRGLEDGKSGSGATTDPSNVDEERKSMAARASTATVGQSIAFSRDLADSPISTMAGNNVVDSSARSLNLIHGSSTRPTRSSGPNSVNNSNASNPQQQQQQQMLFPKQQQHATNNVSSVRSKTPTTSNGNVYPDHITSSSLMAAKFPSSFLVQTSGAPVQSPQWKNSVRPNSPQVSSPSVTTSTASNMKSLPQQQVRSQQNHTQISFGAAAANPKASSTSQGQQAQNNNQAPSLPMVVGSPSTSSVSKGASGSPRTASASTGNKGGAQGSALASQQGKISQSPSLSSQKPSILGSPHVISTSTSGGKPQLQQSQQQPLSKQSIQQAQLYFSNFMQANASTSAAVAGSGYYLQRHRPDGQQQQQQQGSKSQGSGPITSSSGMMSLCSPVSLANTSTSDPAKAVAAAAAAANSMKGLPSQGIFHAAQFAAQSASGAHQLLPAGFPYVHAVSAAVHVKPAEQKQPAGE